MFNLIVFALFSGRACLARLRARRPDPLATVSSLNPAEVGRQPQFGAAILDAAAWLEASGWHDDSAGERQVYASWLLEQRDAYERGEVGIS